MQCCKSLSFDIQTRSSLKKVNNENLLVKQLQYKVIDLNVSDERHVKAYKQKKERKRI